MTTSGTKSVLVDMAPINPLDPGAGFTITSYNATNAPDPSPPSAPYSLDSALIISQVTVVRVASMVGSASIDGVKVTASQKNEETEEYVLYAAPDQGGAAGVWKAMHGLDGEIVTDTGYVTLPGAGGEMRTVTTERLKIDASGNEIHVGQRKEIYKKVDGTEQLIQSEEGTAGERITYYSYYNDVSLPDTIKGKLHIQLNPDGSWVRYFYNAEDGSVSQTWTPWLDAGASTISGIAQISASQCRVEEVQTVDFPVEATTRITRIKGITVSRTVVTKRLMHDGATGQAVEETNTQVFSGSGDLVSDIRSATYQVGGGPLYSIDTNGVRTTQESYLAGGMRNTIITTGSVEHPQGIPRKSLQTVTQSSYTDPDGKVLLERTNVATGAGGYETVSTRTYSYSTDGLGATTTTQYLDGIVERVSTESTSGVSTEADAAGVVTTTSVSATIGTISTTLGTLTTTTSTHVRPAGVGGVVPVGYAERIERSAGGQIRTESETEVNEFGETVRGTDNQGRTVQYTYGLTAEGGRLVTEILPGGLTRITASYRDGQTKSVSGPAVVSEFYTYEVNGRGEVLTTVRVGNANSPRWRRKVSDGVGRLLREESPAVGGAGILTTQHVYNGKGQRIKTIRPGLAAQVFEHDETGQLFREGVDLNGDGILNLSGASLEPVTEYETIYEKVNGFWWEVQRTHVYTGDGSDGRSRRQQEMRRVMGLGPNEITISYDESGASTVSTVTHDPAQLKRYTSTLVQRFGSGSNSLRTETNGLVTSETSPEWNDVATTYTYDAFRRPVTESGPGGTMSYNYDGTYERYNSVARQTGATNRVTSYTYFGSASPSAGQVESVTAPSSRLSLTATASTYFEYDSLGRRTGQWGTGTYPVRYLYDGYGDCINMWTYRTDTAITGDKPWEDDDYTPSATASLTTWNYDAATGWLLSKRDNANQGPSYTYNSFGQLETRTWARTVGGSPLVTTYGYDGAGRLTNLNYSDSTPDVTYGYFRDGSLMHVTDAAGAHVWDRLSTGAGREEFMPATRTWDGLSHIGKPTRKTIGGIGWLAGLLVEQPVDRFGRKAEFRGSFTPAGTDAPAIVLPRIYYQHTDLSTPQLGISYSMAGVPSMSFTRTTSYDGSTKRRTIGYTRSFNGSTSFNSTTEVDPELGIVKAIHANGSSAPFQSRELNGNGINSLDPDITTWPTAVAALGRWAYAQDGRGQIIEAVKSAATTSGGGTLATLPGWSSRYAYDDIGNRAGHTYGTSPFGTGQANIITYTSNALNQYTDLANPRKVHISGAAPPDTTLGINGVAADRHGIHYTGSITAAGAGAKWEPVEIEASRTVGGVPHTSMHEGHVYVPPATETLTYDADGNLTSDGRWNYVWDGENRLVGMSTHADAVAAGLPALALEFGYDFMGRRVRKKVSRYMVEDAAWRTISDLRFIHEGWNIMAEVEMVEERVPGAAGEPGTSPHLVRSYVWGPDMSGTWEGAGGVGGLLGMVRHQQGGGAASAYQATWDLNGNVIGLVGTDGRVAVYDYDAFGGEIRVNEPEPGLCPIRFSTKFTDVETGMCYYGHRYYNVVSGRWLSRDPIEEDGGSNLSAFCTNNPIDRVDVLGWSDVFTFPYSFRGTQIAPNPNVPVPTPKGPNGPKSPNPILGVIALLGFANTYHEQILPEVTLYDGWGLKWPQSTSEITRILIASDGEKQKVCRTLVAAAAVQGRNVVINSPMWKGQRASGGFAVILKRSKNKRAAVDVPPGYLGVKNNGPAIQVNKGHLTARAWGGSGYVKNITTQEASFNSGAFNVLTFYEPDGDLRKGACGVCQLILPLYRAAKPAPHSFIVINVPVYPSGGGKVSPTFIRQPVLHGDFSWEKIPPWSGMGRTGTGWTGSTFQQFN